MKEGEEIIYGIKIKFFDYSDLPPKTTLGTKRRIKEYTQGQRNLNIEW